MSAPSSPSRSLVNGNIQLLRVVGAGGCGVVWHGRHIDLGIDVAVKFLSDDVAHDASVRERFLREAQALAKLRSPYVVRIYDYGTHEGLPYLVMEYLRGEDLEQHLERVGALSLGQTAEICRGVAHALQEAHDLGIVHRDVKSGNIFLARNQDKAVVKLVDFGLVRRAQDVGGADLTTFGAMLGTAYYMSPEQFQDSRRVDHRTDLWALGVVCYECLTGRAPFQAPTLPMLVTAICQGPTPRPSTLCDLPEGADAWFERAFCRRRESRFQSAEEMARTLLAWAAPLSSLSPHSSSTSPQAPTPPASRARTFSAAGILFAILLIMMGLWGLRGQVGLQSAPVHADSVGLVAHEHRSAQPVGTLNALSSDYIPAVPPPTAPMTPEEPPKAGPNRRSRAASPAASQEFATLDAGEEADAARASGADADPWKRSQYPY